MTYSLAALNNSYRPFNLGSVAPFTATDFATAHDGYTLEDALESARSARANIKRHMRLAAQRRADGYEEYARAADLAAANERGMLILATAAVRNLRKAVACAA